MELDFDADYTAAEVALPDGGRTHLTRCLTILLETLRLATQADRGFIALTGFEIGNYTPLAHFGFLKGLPHSFPTSGVAAPESDLFLSQRRLHVRKGTTSLASRGEVHAEQQIHVNLVGHGELVGFICLERIPPGGFDQSVVDQLGANVPLITSLIAEQNFSIRVHRLAQPFRIHRVPNEPALPALLDQIAEYTALGFAADAVALRMYDPETQALSAVASRGDIDPQLLISRHLGEHVAGRLFLDTEHDWATISNSATTSPTGLPILPEERAALQAAGVHACIIMRLSSEAPDDDTGRRLGTLSYHLRRPHQFSWRDLALFRSFCQRAADAIALELQTERLRRSREDLEFEHMLVLAQSSQVTNTDIIKLIAHDLFHRSFHACAALEDYVRRVEKVVKRQGADAQLLRTEGESATNAAGEIQAMLSKLRTLEQSANRLQIESPTPIRLKDAIDEVEDVMGGALNRNKITIKRHFPEDMTIFGPRSIFHHVIFNLVINSIDAARSRATARPMLVFIQARKELRGDAEFAVIQFWDEGPGINQREFRNPADVFRIGSTTKPNGTGTGLPVTRHLLNKHFGGSIELMDPSKALFKIELPMAFGRSATSQ